MEIELNLPALALSAESQQDSFNFCLKRTSAKKMPSGEVRSVQLGDCYSAERLEDFQGDGQIMGLASYKARVLEEAAGSLGCPVSPAGHPPRVGFLLQS